MWAAVAKCLINGGALGAGMSSQGVVSRMLDLSAAMMLKLGPAKQMYA